jgi:hypothetical protein
MHSLETRSCFAFKTGCRRLIVVSLLLSLSCVTWLMAADPYSAALDQRVAELEKSLKEQERQQALGPQAAQSHTGRNLLWALAAIATITIGARLKIKSLNCQFDQRAFARKKQPAVPANGLLQEPSTQAFFDELRAGPTAPSSAALPDSDPEPAEAAISALDRLLDWAPAEATKLQALFGQASRSEDGVTRQQALLELSERLRSLCYGCRVPALRPIWQLAFGLEGLTRQLSRELSEVTASTLQTVAGGLDLLCDVCTNGFKLDSTDQTPARFLVVDDDAVSRFAVAASIKKAFDPPDLAADGETGLVAKNPLC